MTPLGKDFWCHCFGLKIFQNFKGKPDMCSKGGFLPKTWSPAQGQDAPGTYSVRLEESSKALQSSVNCKCRIFSNRVCTHKKMFNLHGRRPIVLTFMTIGCKTWSKHLPDTYYRNSVGSTAINQSSCGRQGLLMEPRKDDLVPCSSLSSFKLKSKEI